MPDQTQERNAEMVALLTPDFQNRAEPQFAWKSACAMYQALPALRGFWPMSSVDYAGANQGIDLSGQGNHLTNNNAATFGYNGASLIPIVNLDGTNQSLSKADGGAGNWADILGTEGYVSATQRGLTIGCWVYFEEAIANLEYVIAKYGNAAANRSYSIRRNAAGNGIFGIHDGIAEVTAAAAAAVASDEWHLIIGRYVPSTEVDIWVDNVEATTVAAVPAALQDSTSNFVVGARSDLTNYLDGRVSMAFLAACAFSDAIIKQIWQQSRVMFNK